MISELKVDGLLCSVHLGWEPSERSVPQDIEVSFRIRFPTPPRALESDALEDTYCYGKLAEKIRACLKDRPFRLIESLAHTLASCVREELIPQHQLSLTVKKLRPPVSGLRGGASFTLSDFPTPT